MADTYTLPALTAANINGIVTAGQDGTYNITYTNLTANQIAEIGAAFEASMQKNLKPVAINNGDYDDLTKKPTIPNGYTQESTFNKIAFSGNYNDLDRATRPELTNWPNTKPAFHEVAFNGDYNNLSNLPNLNASANNSSISGLANVALSGNYEDLNGAPELPEDDIAYNIINEGETNESKSIKPLKLIAFTGNYNDLDTKPSHLKNILNLSNFLDSTNNAILSNFGQTNEFIMNFNTLKENNIYLNQVIKILVDKFLTYGNEIVFINSNKRYDIINVYRELDSNLEVSLIIMDYIGFNNTNYLDIRYNGDNFTSEIASEINQNLSIQQQQGTFIFDYKNNIIYCKLNQ